MCYCFHCSLVTLILIVDCKYIAPPLLTTPPLQLQMPHPIHLYRKVGLNGGKQCASYFTVNGVKCYYVLWSFKFTLQLTKLLFISSLFLATRNTHAQSTLQAEVAACRLCLVQSMPCAEYASRRVWVDNHCNHV